MLIQLPDDVTAQGYVQTRPFQWEQLFYSPSHDFLGTEKDFLDNGIAYKYVQIDSSKRMVV